jgi:TldD protein
LKTVGSEFLARSKPHVRRLIDMLSKEYQYVSVLGTDTRGKIYRVSKTGTEINDIMLAERGFVVRVHNGVNYSEYSFNEIDENKLQDIVEDINDKLHRTSKEINLNEYALIEEEELSKHFFSETEIDPESVSPEDIIRELTELKDMGSSMSELIVNFRAGFSYTHVSKIFLSKKKDLEQSYTIGETTLFCVARRDDKTKYYFRGFNGLKGYEVLKEMKQLCPLVVDQCIKLLDAKTVVPGEYDVICAPDIAGLIAHEAFGHGVEMDMFVKGRAKGAEYIGKQVASRLTTMHDGAAAANHVSSYLFDDEGTIGTDTIVIEDGILKNGISDLLSALKLGTTPTGNGKRQSFERKAYARMTNTFFAAGKDKYEDMLASIRYGYQIEGLYSGMEDPKNWGIQCIALLGREIIDGKFTGNLISPVVMTGFVPDLLQSISMVSENVGLEGGGFCGKGYKEFVKTANGGPYIKAKVRLG